MPESRTRAEVITPPWVRDPAKWPFGKIILPAEPKRVKRLMVGVKTLASQLGCPKDLVRAFLSQGQLHHASNGEKAAGLGLCAEDLAALGLGGLLCTKYNMRLGRLPLATIGDLRDELLAAPRPLRVILGVLRANQRLEARVGTCHGGLAIFDTPQDLNAVSDYYDASDLRDRIDEAIEREPLKLPKPRTCAVIQKKAQPEGKSDAT